MAGRTKGATDEKRPEVTEACHGRIEGDRGRGSDVGDAGPSDQLGQAGAGGGDAGDGTQTAGAEQISNHTIGTEMSRIYSCQQQRCLPSMLIMMAISNDCARIVLNSTSLQLIPASSSQSSLFSNSWF